MKEELKLQQKEFIKRIFIDEVGRLQDNGFYFFSFLVMGQGIEALGCFLDKKPLKARNQSFIRFSNSINKLMGQKYRNVNFNNWLYDKLRSQMTHTFVPSKEILLTSKKKLQPNQAHLKTFEGRLVLVAEDLYQDFVKACTKLFDMMDKDLVTIKKIAASPEELGLE